LRPGQPMAPRPGEKPASGAAIEPIPLDPPKPEPKAPEGAAAVPGSGSAPAGGALPGSASVPLKPTDKSSEKPGEKPALESATAPKVEKPQGVEEPSAALQEARLILEGSQAELEEASKKVDRLKALKNPSSTQRNALATAKKAKLAAEKKVAEAQKRVEELSKESVQPGSKLEEPKPGPAAPSVPGAASVSTPGKAPAEKPLEPEKKKTLGAGRNSIGMEFVPVGDVMFSVYETRLKDYMTFASESGFGKKGWKDPGFEQSLDHPVVRVSWNDANLFCKWLTEKERKLGLLAEGEYYRLPTDLEWSQAIGLKDNEAESPQERDRHLLDQFPWGNQWPPVPGAGNFNGQETGSDIAIKGYSDPFPWTAPVGSGRANAAGIHDLAGNVWEWVMDTYSKDSKARVLRGGAYDSSLKDALSSSCRLPAQPERERDQWGFRVVRAKDGGKPAPKDP
jgi:formylglycine-generating enzyme required for sulfatase activity